MSTRRYSYAEFIIKNCVKKNVLLIIFILLLMVTASLMSLINPIIYKTIVDEIIPEKNIYKLLISLCIMTIVPWLSVFASSVKNYFSAKLGETFTSALRRQCFEKALLSKQENFEKISSTQILNRITRECGRIGDVYITNDLISFVSEVILLISILATMLVFNVKLTLICIMAFPFSFVLTWVVSRKSKKIDMELTNVFEKGQKYLNEVLKMIKLVKLKNGYLREITRLKSWLNEHKNAKLKSSVAHNINRFLIGDFIINIIYGILFFYSGIMVIENQLTLGEMITFITFVPRVYSSLRNVLNIKVSSSVISNSFEKIDQILELPQEKTDGKTIESIEKIEFKNVNFSYSRNDFNIVNFNLTLEKGEKIGIVGNSGGGKSTIFDLLTMLYTPQSGEILINNESSTFFNIGSLRKKISIVTQNIDLFNGTIKSNILYPMDEGDVNNIINIVSLDEFIKRLPNGLETEVGDRGDLLSGGEKQRIAIANALMKDSDVILLDEFTSALDITIEEKIINEILQMDNKITIMISHRIYSILHCNKVLIINDGNIIEEGDPKKLIQNAGSNYYKMYKTCQGDGFLK